MGAPVGARGSLYLRLIDTTFGDGVVGLKVGGGILWVRACGETSYTMLEIADAIRVVVRVLAPEATVPASWDTLPQYAAVDVSPGATLVAAQARKGYIFSLATDTAVTSVVVTDLSETAVRQRAIELQSGAAGAGAGPDAAPRDRESEPRAASAQTPQGRTRLAEGPPTARPGSSAGAPVRDPNAPPGFEFDTYPAQRPVPEPGLEFAPDRDLYPPSGRYPVLGPMGGPGPFRPSGGGMHPTPPGAHQPPHMRYDPTSPFDPPAGAFGSPFNSTGFGPPF